MDTSKSDIVRDHFEVLAADCEGGWAWSGVRVTPFDSSLTA